jgi:hypothetical protein
VATPHSGHPPPQIYPTNGGVMMDVAVLFDGRETQHRVIVGACARAVGRALSSLARLACWACLLRSLAWLALEDEPTPRVV